MEKVETIISIGVIVVCSEPDKRAITCPALTPSQ